MPTATNGWVSKLINRNYFAILVYIIILAIAITTLKINSNYSTTRIDKVETRVDDLCVDYEQTKGDIIGIKKDLEYIKAGITEIKAAVK